MPWKAVELPWHFFSETKNTPPFVAKAINTGLFERKIREK
jgi:hypothetical protein